MRYHTDEEITSEMEINELIHHGTRCVAVSVLFLKEAYSLLKYPLWYKVLSLTVGWLSHFLKPWSSKILNQEVQVVAKQLY